MSSPTLNAPAAGLMNNASSTNRLHPVTFEVLRNAFSTTVDLMAEQILRTCHSFVIYSRDFGSCLADAEGNTVAQGRQDLPLMVGTLHFTAKAVIEFFGDDVHPGDVFAINDPYRGGTHTNDVRFVRPIFHEERLIGWAQSCGHWADVGGSVPGSFDISLSDCYGAGIHIPPVRVIDRGVLKRDVVQLIIENCRAEEDAKGDLISLVEATRIAERETLALCERYGVETIVQAMAEVQDYVERYTRAVISEVPDGTWETVDYLDMDPNGEEGLVPIRVKMTVKGDSVHYDLSGSHPAIGGLFNGTFSCTATAVYSGTKTFFPDVPLNQGFYRAVTFDLGPEGSVVNVTKPVPVQGMSMSINAVMNAVIELWSALVPERAMGHSFTIEYLMVGGSDARVESRPFFMWYDWLVGGWGGRYGRDGGTFSAIVGAGLDSQSVEAQERLAPVLIDRFELLTDSAGPGEFRGGCGAEKATTLLAEAQSSVLSYISERERAVPRGINGGLPSIPQGVTYRSTPDAEPEFLGAHFAGKPIPAGSYLSRPSAGGGGNGDPLKRMLEAVLDDVIDGYVSIERAKTDYGVVIEAVNPNLNDYRIDEAATKDFRREIAAKRVGWLSEDGETVAAGYRDGSIDMLDAVRRYGVILDWSTGELLPRSTEEYRTTLHRRMAAFWD